MTDNLIFHESFDSTRTAGTDTGPNLAQAQAEALVSLLLGHSLALNNTYAFDSRGVLELVRAVVGARNDVTDHLRQGSPARERIATARPFLLSWYGAPSFVQACAAQLRKYDLADPDSRFLLSAWGAIDLKPELRFDLANALLADPRPSAPTWLRDHTDLQDHFEAVRIIMEYAGQYGRGRPTSTEKGTDLLAYLEYYQQLGAEDRRLPELSEKSGCPADISMELWQRIDDELRQKDGSQKLSSRSWVHVAARQASNPEEKLLLERLKELIDTFYNARLAESAYAAHDFLSSVPRSDDIGLKYVNDLAVGTIRDLRQTRLSPPLKGVFTAPENEPRLAVPPLRRLFQAYWSILADDQEYRTWQASCNRVNALLEDQPGNENPGVRGTWAGRFEEAWADHMSLLSRELDEVVRTDDGSLRVVVRQGGVCYEHAHHARLPTSDEIDTALATGRYVSNMAQWVTT